MNKKQVIKHYKSHFGLSDIPFRQLGKSDKLMIEWGMSLVKDCPITDVVKWLPFVPENYERFTEIAKKNKLLKKYDDGSVIRNSDYEPIAICTHFAEEI